MILTVSSEVSGSNSPETSPSTEAVQNGDFRITSPNPDPKSQKVKTGDGKDETTRWTFDFTSDLNWTQVPLTDVSLVSARLTLTLLPKTRLVTTDVVRIEAKSFGNINSPAIQCLKQGDEETVVMELITEGYDADSIRDYLEESQGKVKMVYADDAIVSYAKLDLTFVVVKEKACLLQVEAISEDTIAAPGNNRANYVIVSVTDHCGKPVKDLETSHFTVQALIVGPGGSLVDITDAREAFGMDGFYFIDVKPIRSRDWQPGVYIFAIVVQSASQQGQTLASVLLD